MNWFLTDALVRRLNEQEARIISLESEIAVFERQQKELKFQLRALIAIVNRTVGLVEQMSINPPPQGDE